MSRNRYGDAVEPYVNGNGYGNGGYKSYTMNEGDGYNSNNIEGSLRYGRPSSKSSLPTKVRTGQSRPRAEPESKAGKQIVKVLENIKKEWPTMCEKDCVPVQIAIQLLDTSSVGRAHQYRQFDQAHKYLQDALKAIVHENHQGFNSSIGAYHKIQASIQAAQKRVRNLKESMSQSKANVATTDPELKKLATASQNYSKIVQTLSEIEELKLVPDQLEARISEKRFMTAVDTLQKALRQIRVPELDDIRALTDIKSYLDNQENILADVLIEELHDHLYLKSPYCQERWMAIAEFQKAKITSKFDKATSFIPFHEILDSLDFTETVVENPSINPEADSFFYIHFLVESLNKLGRLEFTVNNIKQRLPVELFAIVNETNSEVDQRHPFSLQGSTMIAADDKVLGSREKSVRSDVISDLLRTLYAKFESIAESHRVLHEVIKAVARREENQSNLQILSEFRELWNLYQNEIQSLLHNYVTTDADIYEFNSIKSSPSRQDLKKEQLFRFSDTDTKSAQMVVEYQELEEIIMSSVPGLISGGKRGSDIKKLSRRSIKNSGKTLSRRGLSISGFESTELGSHKSLVEPSVFNMSLLLPPTLEFLQRLKLIVPPGSDIVTNTLTLFLDNFLVNVFLPQLDETLGKLSDSLFEEQDAFQQDSRWATVSQSPIFKGTIAFFNLITQFSRMLNSIPHDQALTQLIITQMKRYYERCMAWYKSLTSKLRESESIVLKLSASLASNPGDIQTRMKTIWTIIETSKEVDLRQIENEVSQLIRKTNENPLQPDDMILDKETISSLCMLHTSMRWLAIKISDLRYITRYSSNSTHAKLKKPTPREWSLSNIASKDQVEQVHVYLPMTEETVVEFDSIVTSYQEMALTVLLTLHMEIRCQIINSLAFTLSPEKTASYLLEQAVNEPDPKILTFNADILHFDEIIVKFLPQKEVSFIRKGLGLLADTYYVTNVGMIGALNTYGCQRMLLNIFVLQQNLKVIEPEISLSRARKFLELFNQGPDAVINFARLERERNESKDYKPLFNYDELKTLIQLCYSESILNSERTGSSIVVKRNMEEHLLQLGEYMKEP